MGVCACACARARACVCLYLCACVCVCVYVHHASGLIVTRTPLFFLPQVRQLASLLDGFSTPHTSLIFSLKRM